MTTENSPCEPVSISIERAEKPTTFAGKHLLSFHLEDRHAVSVHLTQGELLDLWQKIGAYFNLAGMRDAADARPAR